jgi:hypothetical protein
MNNDIHDIHGPIVSHAHVIWPYFVIAAGVLAAVALVAWLVRKKPATPAERALRELQRTQIADAEQFSTHVCDVIRAYVEDAFGIHAPRRTTDELLADLMTDGSPVAAHRSELGEFLGFCDLAKYARFSLSSAQMTAMLSSAETFVRATAGGAA